uniref:uncharacterized protein LOC105351482 n=1 Tax=Fragaria vesca subsp. vesca TaxID=101020 RepID=UPI0005C96193|nr:PREDICTED: uncharacterized protein LOC105351482 [Fragaria vesca subsp. vesca]
MSGFPKKLILAAVAIYLLVGFLPAFSAVHSAVSSHGGERSLWHIDCRDGKIFGRREGNFGCQGDTVSMKTNPTRSLRATPSPPPSPSKSKAGKQQGAPPPSSVA